MRVRITLLAVGVATILIAFFIVHAGMESTAPVYRDFESYYAGGATWRYGGDPYSREVWRTERTIPKVVATRDELLPFVGPPFGLPIWSTLSRLSWNGATFVWGTTLGCAVAVLVFAGLILGGATPARTRAFAMRLLAALLLVASFAPVTSGVSLGQVAILACAAVALVPFALRGRRTMAKTLVAGLFAALQPNIAVVLLARIANARTAIAIAGAGAIVVGGSALALARYGGFAHYTHVLAEHSAAERAIAIQTTVGAVARGLGATPTVAAIAALTVAIFTIGVVIFQCFSRRYAPDDRLLVASAALPLTWPFAHEHDFAIVFVPALALLLRARGNTWLLASVATLMVAADWLGLAQRPNGIAFEAMRTLVGALGVIALYPGERLTKRAFVPAIVAFCVLFIGLYAAAHPLNVWPDNMSMSFHVPRSFDAAQTWAAEQFASGVGRYTPVNAFLRGLSLLGCALVWLCVSLAFRTEASEATEPLNRKAPAPLQALPLHPAPEQ